MKDIEQKSEGSPKAISPAAESLHNKVIAAEKSVQKAWADFEKKSAAYEDALKQSSDKITLLGLLASTKIAKFTYKIKRTEHKLAKATWKAALKTDKKSVEKSGEEGAAKKQKAKKVDHKAPKDTAAKGKDSGSLESGAPATAKKGKKKAQA